MGYKDETSIQRIQILMDMCFCKCVYIFERGQNRKGNGRDIFDQLESLLGNAPQQGLTISAEAARIISCCGII